MADPSFTLVKRRNPAIRVLADLRDERGTMAAFGTHTYPGAVLYSDGDWLRANRDTAARLARAIVRTLNWMHTHSAQEIAEKTPKALRGEDDALFVEALTNSMSMFSTDGVMTRGRRRRCPRCCWRSRWRKSDATIDLSKTYTNDPVELR